MLCQILCVVKPLEFAQSTNPSNTQSIEHSINPATIKFLYTKHNSKGTVFFTTENFNPHTLGIRSFSFPKFGALPAGIGFRRIFAIFSQLLVHSVSPRAKSGALLFGAEPNFSVKKQFKNLRKRWAVHELPEGCSRIGSTESQTIFDNFPLIFSRLLLCSAHSICLPQCAMHTGKKTPAGDAVYNSVAA